LFLPVNKTYIAFLENSRKVRKIQNKNSQMDDRVKTEQGQKNMELSGRAIAPGLAIGKAFIYQDILQRDHELYDIAKHEIKDEYNRIERAIKGVLYDLELSAKRVEKELDKDLADIFHAHMTLLQDPTLLDEMKKELHTELVNSEQVVKRVFHRWERKFREMEDKEFKQRGDDMADIGRRLLRYLVGIHTHLLEDVPEGSILVAKRLLPSDTVFLSRQSTVAVVVEFGGAGSHAALLTREMGIPGVARIPELLNKVCREDIMIVDGFSGSVIVNPDDKTENHFRIQIKQQHISNAEERKHSRVPARTLNDVTIQVMANVGCHEDVQYAIENGADGVGLYRLEQLYLSRKTPPSEEKLFEEIGQSLLQLKDRPATIRLLDVGGDKDIPYFDMPFEPNPFLGRRGVRLLLEYPELATSQLRVMLRLSTEYNIKILVPMVTLPEEMQRLRNLLADTATDLGIDKSPPLGAMIETPAAALCSMEIAEQADFVSIGTNDLTQYTMVAGRENPLVSDYFIDDHPAILKMLRILMQDIGETPVAVCGELAGSVDAIPMLLEIGVRVLSVAPSLIPKVKEAVRKTHT
jgi:phosphotransferase system enzyme I (PtsI)